jgi:hypothetical protein
MVWLNALLQPAPPGKQQRLHILPTTSLKGVTSTWPV